MPAAARQDQSEPLGIAHLVWITQTAAGRICEVALLPKHRISGVPVPSALRTGIQRRFRPRYTRLGRLIDNSAVISNVDERTVVEKSQIEARLAAAIQRLGENRNGEIQHAVHGVDGRQLVDLIYAHWIDAAR